MSMDVLTDVIAERELERPDRDAGPVVVRIGRPLQAPDVDWMCSFQIRGVGDELVRTAFGLDAVQALRLCMEMIRADLGALQRSHGLTWLGEDDLGF
ncbi:MAG TPA: hypothetical protein VHG28_03615 [Longimicrobiaceae bacterium]|nr:hypothetical protein [Longimicrobiaceae bacterium]